MTVNKINHLHAVHTEGVSVSSAFTHSRASICLLFSGLYAVGDASSL